MRKLLITLLIILISALTIITIVKGNKSFGTGIPSVSEIKALNADLDLKIANLAELDTKTYPAKKVEIDKSFKELINQREKYENLTSVSTDSEVLNAKQIKFYKSDFLWIRLQQYATKNGLNATFDATTSSTGTPNANDLKFTLQGSYTALSDYIEKIENDTELNFRISDFALVPGASVSELKATFTVKDIGITLK